MKLHKLCCVFLASAVMLSFFPRQTRIRAEPYSSVAYQLLQLPNNSENSLNVMSWRDEDRNVLQRIITEYQKSNRNVTIRQEIIPSDQYTQTIQIRLCSGIGISDVIFLKPDLNLFLKIVDRNGLLNLSKQSFLTRYPENQLQLYKIEDSQYGLPYTANIMTGFYNKKIFDELDIKLPETWEETLKVLETIQAHNITPIVCGAEDKDALNKSYLPLFVSNLSKYENPRFFTYDLQDSKVAADDQIFVEFLQIIKELSDRNFFPDSNLELSQSQALNKFANNRAAIFLDSTSSISRIHRANPKLEFGFLNLPLSTGETMPCGSVGSVLGIDAKTRCPEQAKAFVKYLSTPGVANEFGDGTGQMVFVKGANLSSPDAIAIKKLYKSTIMDPSLYMEEYDPWIREPLNDMVARVMSGQSVDMAVKSGQEIFKALRIPKYQIVS